MKKEEHALRGKTARAVASFVALAMIPYAVPALSHYRVLVPASLLSLIKVKASEASSLGDVTGGQSQRPGDDAKSTLASPQSKPGEVEDPSGHALDNFFAALARAEMEGKQARICHYGDSPITNDGITSTVRRRLQLRFGDAGHGFILIAKPWGWYGHTGVTHEASRGWKADPLFISDGDHRYGLGGAAFTAEAAGVTSSFATSAEAEVGRSVSSFDIYFETEITGGDFEVEVDGRFYGKVSTAGDEARSAFHRVEVEEGPHAMTLKTAGNGPVRLFGVALESSHAGVQYDSLGVNGAFIGLLAHYLDRDHWAEQLRHRQPDLVIIGYGANESQFEKLPMDQYERDTKEVIRRIREALPRASILFVGPMDRGMRGAGGAIITRPMIPRLIGYQRRIAAETGCAFFDTFAAMGGEGTVARWFESRPKLMGGDFTHPTAQGAEIVGSLIYDAIIKAYEQHEKRR